MYVDSRQALARSKKTDKKISNDKRYKAEFQLNSNNLSNYVNTATLKSLLTGLPLPTNNHQNKISISEFRSVDGGLIL